MNVVVKQNHQSSILSRQNQCNMRKKDDITCGWSRWGEKQVQECWMQQALIGQSSGIKASHWPSLGWKFGVKQRWEMCVLSEARR